MTTPVTGSILATEELILNQVPPETGATAIVVVAPIHIALLPVMLTVGLLLIVIGLVGNEGQPVVASVNTAVMVPTATPVTRPPLETVAIEPLELAHDPPVVGDN